MVQMARQKELAKTPTKRPPSPTQTKEEADALTMIKRRRTARRRLLPLYEDAESSDEVSSIPVLPRVSNVIQVIHEFCIFRVF